MPYFSSRTCWWHCPRCPWHLRDQSDLSATEFLLSGGRGQQSCEFSEREQNKLSRWRHYPSRLPQWPLGTARALSWAARPPEDTRGSWSSRSALPLCPESTSSPKVDFVRRVYFLLGEEFNSVSLRNSIFQIPLHTLLTWLASVLKVASCTHCSSLILLTVA